MISEKAYSLFINNYYEYKIEYLQSGIIIQNKTPKFVKNNLQFTNDKGCYKFSKLIDKDTIKLEYKNDSIYNKTTFRTDPFTEKGVGNFKDLSLKNIEISIRLKNKTPDKEYFAYWIFYKLL